jgi:hypothetical protein
MMKATAGIGLWGLTALTGFAVGMAIGRATKPKTQPHQPVVATTKKEADPQRSRLLASLEALRNTLSEKEQTADDLRAGIEEVQAKLLPPLSPEDEKWLKERQKEDRRNQRWKRVLEQKKQLKTKIRQRRDKVVRADGLDEMTSLFESEDPDDVLVAIETLRDLLFDGPRFDRERFKPLVLAALAHEDWEIRQQAIEYVGFAYFGEEAAGLALGMIEDTHPRVKHQAFDCLWSCGAGAMERHEDIAQSLRALLHSEDKEDQSAALWHIYELARAVAYRHGQPGTAYDYYGEMEERVMELSRDPELEGDLLGFWWRRRTLSKEALERSAEILAATDPDKRFDLLHQNPVSPEMRELACRHYFRVLTESLETGPRLDALAWLARTGDKSLVPELQAIAASEDAEGIGGQLEQAIKRLELYGRE